MNTFTEPITARNRSTNKPTSPFVEQSFGYPGQGQLQLLTPQQNSFRLLSNPPSPRQNHQHGDEMLKSIGLQLTILRFIKKLRLSSNILDIYSQRLDALSLIGDKSMNHEAYKQNQTRVNALLATRREKTDFQQSKARQLLSYLSTLRHKNKERLYYLFRHCFFAISTINPDNGFVWYFNILVLIATVVNLFLVSFIAAFLLKIDSRHLFQIQIYFQIPMHSIFVLDLILKFNTGYYKDGQMIRDRRLITTTKLNQIYIDVLTILPWLSTLITRDWDILYYLQLVFLIRIGNLYDMVEGLSQSHQLESSYQYIWQMIKLSYLMVFGSHINACLWYLLGAYNDDSITWVQKYIDDDNLKNTYLISLYWSVTTMLTVGYGDILPTNDYEITFAILTMLIGCCLFGYVMSSIGSLFDQINSQKSEIKKEMKRVNIFLASKSIDESLKNSIRQYLYNYLQKLEMKHIKYSQQYIPMLSLQLRNQMVQQLFQRFITHRPLLTVFSSKLWIGYLSLIQEKILMPDDIISGTDLFSWHFVLEGQMAWKLGKERTGDYFVKIQEGEHFSEWSFFSGQNQNYGNYMALSFSSILVIEREQFISFIRTHSPKDHQHFCSIQDRLNLYEDFQSIGQMCIVCYKYNHSIFRCPQLHFNSNKNVLRNNNRTNQRFYQKRNEPIKRWKTRLYCQYLQANAVIFYEDFEDQNEFQTLLKSMYRLQSCSDASSVDIPDPQSSESYKIPSIFSTNKVLQSASDTGQANSASASTPQMPSNEATSPDKMMPKQNSDTLARPSITINLHPQRKKAVNIQSEEIREKIAYFLSNEYVEQIRRRRSQRIVTTDTKVLTIVSQPIVEDFFKVPDFDIGHNFEIYFPKGNKGRVIQELPAIAVPQRVSVIKHLLFIKRELEKEGFLDTPNKARKTEQF